MKSGRAAPGNPGIRTRVFPGSGSQGGRLPALERPGAAQLADPSDTGKSRIPVLICGEAGKTLGTRRATPDSGKARGLNP